MFQRFEKYYQEAVVARWRLVQFLPVAGVKLLSVVAIVNLVAGLLPVAFIVATGVAIGYVPDAVQNDVGSAAWNSLITAFLLASAAFIAQQLLFPAQIALGELVKQRVDGAFHRRIITAALRSTGLGPVEDPVALDRLYQATQMLGRDYRTPGDAIAGLIRYISRYGSLLGYCIIAGLAIDAWWPPAIVALSTMIFRYGHRGGMRMWMHLWPSVGRHRRRRDYFRNLGLGSQGAKELRIFHLTDWVMEGFRSSAIEAMRPMWKARRRASLYNFLVYAVIGLIIDILAVGYVVESAANGQMTLTELALALQSLIAAILLGTFYQESDEHTQFGMDAVTAIGEFEQKVDRYAANDVVAGALNDASDRPHESVQFDRVSFSYDENDQNVLDRLNLTICAGKCTAIVGLNGAGKTTLVKLLTRLYQPKAGMIRVDGQDVRDYTVNAWRRQIAVVFQDFTQYEMSVTDNIVVGAIERTIDHATVRAVAAKAGLLDFIEKLPRGFDTILSRQYDDGTDLSGGQWQKIAIARALYAIEGGAKILVLDEPTAALDVRAEVEFFDQFLELTRGLTTLLISHRLSSVRRADRIVVLENGQVVEDGTHTSLLACGGRYAKLFNLQAQYFTASSNSGKNS